MCSSQQARRNRDAETARGHERHQPIPLDRRDADIDKRQLCEAIPLPGNEAEDDVPHGSSRPMAMVVYL